MSENILEVKDLVVHFETDDGCVKAVNGLNFSIGKKKTLGLVGETGAGKSSTMLALLNMVPNPPGVVKAEKILVNGLNVLLFKNVTRISLCNASLCDDLLSYSVCCNVVKVKESYLCACSCENLCKIGAKHTARTRNNGNLAVKVCI